MAAGTGTDGYSGRLFYALLLHQFSYHLILALPAVLQPRIHRCTHPFSEAGLNIFVIPVIVCNMYNKKSCASSTYQYAKHLASFDCKLACLQRDGAHALVAFY
jgi:hypothetical protein